VSTDGASQDAWAIRIEGLGKYFGESLDIDGASQDEAARTLARIFGLQWKASTTDVRRGITVPGHVLRDISLDVERGTVLCLTGATGSGKSVLLRILAGILRPTTGRVTFRGRVASLVEMNRLDTRLTGMENIAAFRQMIQMNLPDSFDEDVMAFAGLQGFEHAPVRTYSKGMTVRLGAGLALASRPDILLLDDVLAVGDIAFQQACIERIHDLKAAGCTIVAAFADDTLVAQLATRIVTLVNGRVTDDGPPAHWARTHHGGGAGTITWDIAPDLPEDDVMALRSIDLRAQDGEAGPSVAITLAFEVKTGPLTCRPSIFVMRDRTVIFRSLFPRPLTVAGPALLTATVELPAGLLGGGDYRITSNMWSLYEHVHHSLKADAIGLHVGNPTAAPVPDDVADWTALAAALPWEIERVAEGAA